MSVNRYESDKASLMRVIESVDLKTARRIAIICQGLAPDTGHFDNSISGVCSRLGCVQIDSIQAVRRSQEIVLLSRGVHKSHLATLYKNTANVFETWGHAHSLMSQTLWPIMHWRRDNIRRNGLAGPPLDRKIANEVLHRITNDGPTTYTRLGCVVGKGWNRTSAFKTACEWLLGTGQLVVTSRDQKWRRIYSTPEQVGLSDSESLTIEDSLRKTVEIAVNALGIATVADIRDYFRFPKYTPIREWCLDLGLIPVQIEGTKNIWFTSNASLDEVSKHSWQGDSVFVLSPFDSLIWHRPRQLALFGKDYRLEIYKPASLREFGYYSMPILFNDTIIGRVAAKLKGDVVSIENFEVDDDCDQQSIRNKVIRAIEYYR